MLRNPGTYSSTAERLTPRQFGDAVGVLIGIHESSTTVVVLVRNQTMGTYPRPQAGTNVNETHVVTMLPSPPSPSVSVRLGDGKAFLSKRQVQAMADDSASIHKMWEIDSRQVTEEQRLRMIYGRRASDLLQAISDHADEAEYLADESKLPREARYLLSELLEDGAAAVVSLQTGHLIPTLKVHYMGFRAGPTVGQGLIMFVFDTGSDRGLLLTID
jgi:hypothetical protein